jgi:hypothetical protein
MRIETGGYTDAEVVGGGALTDPTKATGWLDFSAVPAVNDTATIGTEVFTFSDSNEAWSASRISNSTKLSNRVHIGSTAQEAAENLHACIKQRNRIITNEVYVTIERHSTKINFTSRKCGSAGNTFVLVHTIAGATTSGATLTGGTDIGSGRFRPCRAFLAQSTGVIQAYLPNVEDIGDPHFDGGDVVNRCPTGKAVSLPVTSGQIYPITISGSSASVVALY